MNSVKEISMEDLRTAESSLAELKYMQNVTRIDPTSWRGAVCMATAAVMVTTGRTHSQLRNAKMLEDYKVVSRLCAKHKVPFGPKLEAILEYSFQPHVVVEANHLGFNGVAMPGVIGQTEAVRYVHACKKLLVAMGTFSLAEYEQYIRTCINSGIEQWLTVKN